MPALATTNTFAVTDLDALTADLATRPVSVIDDHPGPLVSLTTAGRWDRATADTVGRYLRPGQIAVFMHPDQPVEHAYPFMATRTHTIEADLAAPVPAGDQAPVVTIA